MLGYTTYRKLGTKHNGHWKIIDGIIDYDAESEAKGEKNLMSEKGYKDFTLMVDWLI
ncbi:MAG: DUF1080 domain-containing protein [Flammeovirgaceae bacterium]|nr:DUF1080 domain-containing protein [Flammeovirgaceae bacterium]